MPQNQNILKLHSEKNGIKINKEVANTPSLIIVNSRSLLFPELNQLLFKGILACAQRALRQCKVND